MLLKSFSNLQIVQKVQKLQKVLINSGETGTNFLDGVKVACFKIFCLQRHLYAELSDSVLVQNYGSVLSCL